jgi:hypothetical protein
MPPLMERNVDVLIADLAARQHGVVTRRQLLAAGASEKQIRHRVAVRWLHAIHRGVYSVGHPRLLRASGRYLGAVFACGDGAVLSHRAGAAHLGIRPSASSRIDVTVPRRGATAKKGVTLHRTRRLEASEVMVHEGIPCTTPARTLMDLAGVVGATELQDALERSVSLGHRPARL